jgi:hypothetical protein
LRCMRLPLGSQDREVHEESSNSISTTAAAPAGQTAAASVVVLVDAAASLISQVRATKFYQVK